MVAARRCHPGAEPGREKIFSGFELERDWLLRLSRNCLKSGGGGRAATTSHLCKEGCLLFTPGSFHSWRKPTFISPASHLYLNYCDIYRPPDEVTTILSRKLVEAKIKKKSKSRSFNFPQQMQENLQSKVTLYCIMSRSDDLISQTEVFFQSPDCVTWQQ